MEPQNTCNSNARVPERLPPTHCILCIFLLKTWKGIQWIKYFCKKSEMYVYTKGPWVHWNTYVVLYCMVGKKLLQIRRFCGFNRQLKFFIYLYIYVIRFRNLEDRVLVQSDLTTNFCDFNFTRSTLCFSNHDCLYFRPLNFNPLVCDIAS